MLPQFPSIERQDLSQASVFLYVPIPVAVIKYLELGAYKKKKRFALLTVLRHRTWYQCYVGSGQSLPLVGGIEGRKKCVEVITWELGQGSALFFTNVWPLPELNSSLRPAPIHARGMLPSSIVTTFHYTLPPKGPGSFHTATLVTQHPVHKPWGVGWGGQTASKGLQPP